MFCQNVRTITCCTVLCVNVLGVGAKGDLITV